MLLQKQFTLTKIEVSNWDSTDSKENMLYIGRFVPKIEAVE